MLQKLPLVESFPFRRALRTFLSYLCCIALILGDGNAARAVSPVVSPADLLAALTEQLKAVWTQTFSQSAFGVAPPESFTSQTYVRITEDHFENDASDLIFEDAVHLTVPGTFTNTGRFSGKQGTHINAQKVHNQHSATIGTEFSPTAIFAEEVNNTHHSAITGSTVYVSASNGAGSVSNVESYLGGNQGTVIQANHVHNHSAHMGGSGTTAIHAQSLNNHPDKDGKAAGIGGDHVELVVAGVLSTPGSHIIGQQTTYIAAQRLDNVGGHVGAKESMRVLAQDITNHKGVIEGNVTEVAATHSVNNLDARISGTSGTKVAGEKIYNQNAVLGGGGQTSVAGDNIINTESSYIRGSSVRVDATHLSNQNESYITGATRTEVQAQNMNNQGAHTGGGGTTSITANTLTNQPNGAGKVGGIGGVDVKISVAGVLANPGSHIIGQRSTDIQANHMENKAGYVSGVDSIKVATHNITNERSGIIEGGITEVTATHSFNNLDARISGTSGTKVAGEKIYNQNAVLGGGGQTSVAGQNIINTESSYIRGSSVRVDATHLSNQNESYITGATRTEVHAQSMNNQGAHTGGGGTTAIHANNLTNQPGRDGKFGGVGGAQVELFVANLLTNFRSQIIGTYTTSIHAKSVQNDRAYMGSRDHLELKAETLTNHGSIIESKEVEVGVADTFVNQESRVSGQHQTTIHAETVHNQNSTLGGWGPTSVVGQDIHNTQHAYIRGTTVGVAASNTFSNTDHSYITGAQGTEIRVYKMNNQGAHTGGGGTTSIAAKEFINQKGQDGQAAGVGGDHVDIVIDGPLSNLLSDIIGQMSTQIEAKTIRNDQGYVGSGGLTSIIARELLNLGNSRGWAILEGQLLSILADHVLNQNARASSHHDTKIHAQIVQNDHGTLGGGGKTFVKGDQLVENIAGDIQGGTALYVGSGKDLISQSTLKPSSRHEGRNLYQNVELEKQARFLVTDSTPSGTLNVDADGNMHLVATEIRNEGGGEARLWAGGTISAPSVEITSQSKTYGSDGFTEIQETWKHRHPTKMTSQGPVRSYSKGESTFQATQFQGQSVELGAGGRLDLPSDRSSHQQQRHWDRRGLWFNEGKNYAHYVEQMQPARVSAPGFVKIHGVGGTAIDQEKRLKVKEDEYEFYTYTLDPGVAKGVSGQPNVYRRTVQANAYESIEKQTQLTPVGAAMVALAAMVLTNGVGASLAKSLGFVSNTLPFAMVEAGVQAAIASASIQVVQGQGDLDRTLRGLASPENLKSIVAAMLTAGMTRGFLSAMKVPVVARVDPLITSGSAGSGGLGGVVQSASMTGVDWSHRLVAHGVMATTSTFVRGILSGGDPEVIKAAALTAIGTAMATEGSLVLGEGYHSGDMGWLPHKVGHGLVGCVSGAIMGSTDDPAKGCLAGGLGAVAGEVIGEKYLQGQVPALIHGDVSQSDLIQQTGNVARFAGGFVAGAAGGDVNIGAQTGGVAAENNAAMLVPVALFVGYAALEGGGDTRAGLEKIHDGEDTISKTWKALKSSSVGRMIASGKAELTKATYEAFPDAMARLEKMKAVFGEGVQAALTYLDTKTGHVVTRFWDSLDPSTKNQILGGAELFSWVAGVGVVAGAGKVLTTTVMSKEVSGLGRRALGGGGAGKDGPTNRATHEKYVVSLRQEMGRPHVNDKDLSEAMEELYRENATVGSGSTAAALRQEKLTGEPTKGSFHSRKASERIKNLERWLKNNPHASPGDRAAAENVIRDMQNALRGE